MLLRSTSALLAAVSLISCSNQFTPQQREALSSVSIASPTMSAKAYREPHGGSPTGSSPVVGVPGNPAAGAVGGALGQLIIEGISATQDKMFESNRGNHFPAVERNTPNPAPMVHGALERELKKDSFFGPRLSATGKSRLETEVVSYGLVRTTKDQAGEILLAPSVTCRFRLMDSSSKSLANATLAGTGPSHPIHYYSGAKDHTHEAFATAAGGAASQFVTQLQARTRP